MIQTNQNALAHMMECPYVMQMALLLMMPKWHSPCTATDDLGYSGTYLSGETAALTSEVAATSTALRYVWALT